MLKNLLLTILIWTALSTKLRVTVDRNKGPVCFYESLSTSTETQRQMKSTDIWWYLISTTSEWTSCTPKKAGAVVGKKWSPSWEKE